jgi:hypothetical protein
MTTGDYDFLSLEEHISEKERIVSGLETDDEFIREENIEEAPTRSKYF